MPETRWYAIHTRHQHEKAVTLALEYKGFEIFLPLYSSLRRWKDRTKHLQLPLFPCYLFLHGSLDRRREIIETSGVCDLVPRTERPVPIPQPEIDAVYRVLENKVAAEPHQFLQRGDWVRVKSGALLGVEGILVRWKNLWRLVLSVELLQQAVAVEVDTSMVEPAVRPAARPVQEGSWAWARARRGAEHTEMRRAGEHLCA